MSPSPVKMTQGQSDLMAKCLEIIQALESKGQTFNLKIKSGDFFFSLDTRGTTPKVEKKIKKLSPSQQRRNLKRKEEFLKRKSENSVAKDSELTPDKNKEEEENAKTPQLHKCTLCDKVFSTENGMKIHKGKAHDTEKLRSSSTGEKPLTVSPVRDTRTVPCHNCGEDMYPAHLCEQEEFVCTAQAGPFAFAGSCGKKFGTKEQLEEHAKEKHTKESYLMTYK